MPIYDFSCNKCNFKFDDFLKSFKEINPQCTKCGSETTRLMSRFSCNVVGSENKSLDSLIGADSERRWEFVNKRKEKRLKIKKGNKNVRPYCKKNK